MSDKKKVTTKKKASPVSKPAGSKKEFNGLLVPSEWDTSKMKLVSKFSYMVNIDRGKGPEKFAIVKTADGLEVIA